jgi:hypothetical protein
MTYEEFLKTKDFKTVRSGFECDELNENLFDYQKAIVKWALRKGRCALPPAFSLRIFYYIIYF